MSNELRDFLAGELKTFAGNVAKDNGIRLTLKTNLGPEITLYEADNDTGPNTDSTGLLDLIGIKAALTLSDNKGNVIYTSGNKPETDLLRAGVLVSVIALSSFIILRGVLPRFS